MRPQHAFALAALVALFALLPAMLYALSSSSPQWAPTAPKTNDTLNCSWTVAAEATAQNITILKEGAAWNSTFENESLPQNLSTSTIVPASATAKNEHWTCLVIQYNDTDAFEASVNVTIVNSPPTTEGAPNGIFWSGTDIGYVFQVEEDETYALDINASDTDGDTITYGPSAEEFCVRDAGDPGRLEGHFTCSPTDDDLASHATTALNLTFTVTDSQNPGGRTVMFNITAINDPPAATLTTRTTAVNQSLTPYDFTATDEEGNTPFTFALLDPPAEIADKLAITNISASGARITYDATAPDYDDVNTTGWLVTVNITDSANASSTASFLLNITPVGRTPYFVAVTPTGPYVLNQSDFLQINLSANDPDENETLTFTDDTTRFVTVTTQQYTNVSNATAQINFTPSDDDVGSYLVTITVHDSQGITNTTTLNITVLNLNDPPVLYNESFSSQNTFNQTNLSNVTSYANAPFVFLLNATDPDLDSGDALRYWENSSLFEVNRTTGVISFTPQPGDVSPTPYVIRFLVNDTNGSESVETALFWVLDNNAPYFTGAIPDQSCAEGTTCAFDVSAYAADDDLGDSINSFSATVNGTLTGFSMNATAGTVSFTPIQQEIGDYLVNLTITDQKGATAATTFILHVVNTNDTPNLTRYDTWASWTIVATHPLDDELRATDRDLVFAALNENLTFSTNLSWASLLPLSISNDTVTVRLTLDPNASHVGSQAIRIRATDSTGRFAEKNVTFTVLADSEPPNITAIRPYGNASNSSWIVDAFIATTDSSFGGTTSATVSFSENTTVTFSHHSTDDLTPNASLQYYWLDDGLLRSTSHNYTRTFNFTTAGSHNVTLFVQDDRLENSSWTWLLSVENRNRPPRLEENLTTPLLINETTRYENYFVQSATTKFYDPDDDSNENGNIDGNETNTLVFTATACEVATLAITGLRLDITPTTEGNCSVRFTATDPYGLNVQSNLVQINVSDLAEGEVETETVNNPSGGGGSSTTRNSYIPITREKKTPEAVNIIAPALVTVYENSTVVIPVAVTNTWTKTISYIRLAAEVNSSGVTATLDSNIIEELSVNESRDLLLTVTDYRLGENYEIRVHANVSDPVFEDSALILLTSIEQASAGDEVEVKVTFARDLFNEHPECQELNELLDKANGELANGDVASARAYVDTAINGCKYLVSTLGRRTERPDAIPALLTLDDLTLTTVLYGSLALIALLTIAFIVYYHYTNREEDQI